MDGHPSVEETRRLRTLHQLGLLDTPPEERFDRITRVAAALFDVPIALVSLVDLDRQWFKSCYGLPQRETERGASFCAHAITGAGPLVIPDATADTRFAGNRLVTGEPHIRAYAGHPLSAPDGAKLGTLCVIDRRARQFDPADLARLADLARWAEETIAGETLRTAHARLHALLHAATGHAIIATDRSGVITVFNEGAERMLGYRADEVVGVATPVVFHDPAELDARARELGIAPGFGVLVHAARARGAAAGDWTYVRRNGDRLAVSGAVGAVTDDTGELDGYVAVVTDVTAHRAAVAALAASEERFRALVQHASDGIVVLDEAARVRYASPAAVELVGAPATGVDFDVFGVIHPDDRPAAVDAFAQCVDHPGGTTRVEVRVRGGDASYRWLEIVANSRLDDPAVAGIVANLRDVTERREVQRLKDEIISVVSHELRTPLTSMSGSLRLLAGGVYGDLPAEAAGMVALAVESSDRLIRLVNGMLDLQRLESGAVSLEPLPCPLGGIVGEAVDDIRGLAERSGIDIDTDVPDVAVTVDRDRIVQVLTNLLSNAVKFSPAATTVRVTGERAPDAVIIRVTDKGRGIPAARLESIFEPFEQVDASDSRERGGTGLGLAIARRIVVQHGGRIWAESTPGRGSTFSFTVPRSQPGPDAPATPG